MRVRVRLTTPLSIAGKLVSAKGDDGALNPLVDRPAMEGGVVSCCGGDTPSHLKNARVFNNSD